MTVSLHIITPYRNEHIPSERFRVQLAAFKRLANMPHDAEWKILAEEASQEKDPVKLLEIILSLTAAIDKEQSQKAQHFQKQAQIPTSPPPA